ncbi:MAG TPA: TIGR03085 family metal-binding protein [Actinokineospora sp.]|nr:TIGR03085 family metal-binding protein [Actinokineospora sp.]
MSLAKDERAHLCDLFTEVGPDAPTLCGEWKTRDLAAHLVVRERRPDAAGGILVKPLASYLDRVQNSYAAKPWPDLVALVRSGPPLLSVYHLPGMDDLLNTTEFYVHHEDVRRATAGWQPRPADKRRDAVLWAALSRSAKMMFRKSPVGIILRTPEGKDVTAKRGPDTVTITGASGELLFYAFGRSESIVEFEGDQAAIGLVNGISRGL